MTSSVYEHMRQREHEAVRKLKNEIEAWRLNCERLGLEDRLDFQEWQVRNFTAEQLAIYGEMDWDDDAGGNSKRDHLHKLYMESKYGPSDD